MQKYLSRLTVLSLLVLLAHNPCWAFTGDPVDDPNCQGAWLMEDDGNETDESGNGNPMIETGGDIPQDADRKFGDWSRDFEADDTEYLTHADGLSTDIFGADQKISLVCWEKTETAQSFGTLINKGTLGTGDMQYSLARRGATDIMRCTVNADAYTCEGAATDWDDGSWHHAAMVYNDIDVRLYQDGVLDENAPVNPDAYTTGSIDTPNAVQIGLGEFGGGPSGYWDGLLDDAAIFDDDLSSTEVNDIMDNGLKRIVVAARPQLISIMEN